MKDNKEIVRDILTKYSDTRDCDKTLYWKFYEMVIYGDLISSSVLLKENFFNMPTESTLSRYRRLLQRYNPNLRGSLYVTRKKYREPKTREKMNDMKWEEIQTINSKRCES